MVAANDAELVVADGIISHIFSHLGSSVLLALLPFNLGIMRCNFLAFVTLETFSYHYAAVAASVPHFAISKRNVSTNCHTMGIMKRRR